jgi:hypothetical protein
MDPNYKAVLEGLQAKVAAMEKESAQRDVEVAKQFKEVEANRGEGSAAGNSGRVRKRKRRDGAKCACIAFMKKELEKKGVMEGLADFVLSDAANVAAKKKALSALKVL